MYSEFTEKENYEAINAFIRSIESRDLPFFPQSINLIPPFCGPAAHQPSTPNAHDRSLMKYHHEV